MPNKYWFCPIYCFSCESDTVNLEGNVQIVRIPPEFHTYLFEESDSSFFRTLPFEVDWIISIPQREVSGIGEIREGQMKQALEEMERVKDLTVDLITALRLSKEGRVIPGLLMSASYPTGATPSFGGTTVWTSVSSLDFFVEESTYRFSQDDLTTINSLFKEIIDWRNSGVSNQLKIPLYRFHSAYLGPIEERLVDQVIGLESLYLGDPQELSYKLAMRTAYLLGNTREARSEIFNDIKKAYNYRSKIVHGNDPPSREQLREIVPRVEEYLRQSLKKYLVLLNEGNTIRQIQQELLDNSILEGGQ